MTGGENTVRTSGTPGAFQRQACGGARLAGCIREGLIRSFRSLSAGEVSAVQASAAGSRSSALLLPGVAASGKAWREDGRGGSAAGSLPGGRRVQNAGKARARRWAAFPAGNALPETRVSPLWQRTKKRTPDRPATLRSFRCRPPGRESFAAFARGYLLNAPNPSFSRFLAFSSTLFA